MDHEDWIIVRCDVCRLISHTRLSHWQPGRACYDVDCSGHSYRDERLEAGVRLNLMPERGADPVSARLDAAAAEQDVMVTEGLIMAGRSPRGAWSREQLRLIGVPWPPQRGWKRQAIGRRISVENAQRFLGEVKP